VPGLLLTIPYTAVQFVALHQAKEAAAHWGLTGEGPLLLLCCSMVASMAWTMW
jgi:solute carrier family 25 (mitochondrial thiamine pyrophosphate transporter), member 19